VLPRTVCLPIFKVFNLVAKPISVGIVPERVVNQSSKNANLPVRISVGMVPDILE